jgi:hypothetical protein
LKGNDMSEFEISAEGAIAAATANMAWDAYDGDGTLRIKKVTLAQVATWLRGNNGNNVTAAIDPGAGNDNTQGYFAGSLWVNTTNGRVWIAQSVATGAAAWALAVVPGTGVEPASNLEQFGAGTATILAEGNVNRQISSAGINPGPAPTTCWPCSRSRRARSMFRAAASGSPPKASSGPPPTTRISS